MSQEKHKLAIISMSFPPIMAGSTVLMNNLFQDYQYPLEAVVGLSYSNIVNDFPPPCKTTYLKLPFEKMEHALLKYPFLFKPLIKRFIRKNILRIKPKAVYIAYPSGFFLVYAAEVCMELKIPYIVHMHDLWEENTTEGTYENKLAVKKEKYILENAAMLLCMTTLQSDFYKEKYGLNSFYLPHTIPEKRQTIIPNIKYNFNPSFPKKILYSGSIDRVINKDAIKQFIKAIDFLPENYEIRMLVRFDKDYFIKEGLYNSRVIYDWVSPEKSFEYQKDADVLFLPLSFNTHSHNEVKNKDYFIKEGLYNSRVIYDWVSPEKSFEYQKDADVLFLPLSFNTHSHNEVKTVFATKTLDYLVSGTPIFCIAPADSFHSIDAKEKGWAKVLNDDNPESIAQEITKLLSDQNSCTDIVNKALIEAENRASKKFGDKLYALISSI